MAVNLSADLDVKRKDMLSVFPQDLIVNPANRGREFAPGVDKVQELATSIKEQGQLQPVTVRVTHDRKLELVAGFTRYEAVLLLNASEPEPRRILCKVEAGNDEDMFLANLAENRHRNDTSAIDDAYNVRRLERDFGKTDEQIRAIYGGKSQAWLDHTIRPLLTLSRDQQKAIHEGQLTAATGLVLAQLAPEVRDEVLAEAKKESKGSVTATAVLKQARQKGALVKTTGLKPSEVKAGHVYLGENTENPKVKKFCKAYADYTAGVLPEPDYFRIVKKLLSE